MDGGFWSATAAGLGRLALLSLLVLSCFCNTSSLNWQDNRRPKIFFSMSSRDYTSFIGNLTAPDHFSVLYYTDLIADAEHLGSPSAGASALSYGRSNDKDIGEGVVLLGARNLIYKLTASELRLRQTLIWHASDFDRDSCVVKGKARSDCQNFITVIQQFREDPARYMVCGTNAFKPMCREYVDERGSYVMRTERSGLGLAPFDPAQNSTATLVGEELYAGTVADIMGVDPIIFREPLRTQQYDSVQLNSPDFVGSFEYQDFVFLFFREPAVEHINCGKAVFSRVARVCKNDRGGPNKARNSWTTFLKARLNCSVPGDFPFYFDEIQDVTRIIRGRYGGEDDRDNDDVIYATFSTLVNSIGGSAVCAFRMKDIRAAFEGRFKEQRSMSENWLPVEDHKVPQDPRPGTCINDSRTLPEMGLNFIKRHSLMDQAVEPFFGSPIVIRTGFLSRFTAIAVDPQVKTTDGQAYDVIFVGTTNGRVLKVINAKSSDTRKEVDSVVIEELVVFPSDVSVKDVQILGPGNSKLSQHHHNVMNKKKQRHGNNGGNTGKSLSQLAVMSETELRSFPVQRCDRASTCADCVALQDPYCAWEIRSSRCSSGDWTKNMASSFVQSVSDGRHSHCPPQSPLTSTSSSSSSETFSYEKYLADLRIGQIVNVVDGVDTAQSALPGAKDGRKSSAASSAGGAGGKSSTDGGGSMSDSGVQIVEANPILFSLETLIITVSAGAVAALVVGFVTGYCCGRRCRKEAGDDHMIVSGRGGALGAPMGGPFGGGAGGYHPDTEYEYFEQRGGLARPMMIGGGPGGPSAAAPLLPQNSAKMADGRHEEVTYADPDLVLAGPMFRNSNSGHGTTSSGGPTLTSHLSLGSNGGQSGGPSVNFATPNLSSSSGQQLRFQNSEPLGGGPQPSAYSSSLLHHHSSANKFNTIHHGASKRGGRNSHDGGVSGREPNERSLLPSVNHYETAAEARLGSGKDPSFYARGRDNINSYHMSTLGRSTSMRSQQPPPLLNNAPLLPFRNNERNQQATTSMMNQNDSGGSSSSSQNDTAAMLGNRDGAGGRGGGEGERSNASTGSKGAQVVDSAYGTTRSVKNKVYL